MKLKKFSTEIFAGIKNREYEFKDGLNILIGNNEAGKSTIINAIFAALFIAPQIKLNRSEGIEFKEQYLPYPEGDYAAAKLLFEQNNLEYKLYKKWSNNNYQGYLELPDGQRIEDRAKIKDHKNQILRYGKSTYHNIVFSSQKNIKSIIERISAEKNPELVDTISSFLRKAVMELDGISIDKFRNKLETELEELTKKWNLDSMSVSNSNRGLNNPYKVGTGKIYDSFIAKESLRREIKEGKLAEKDFAAINKEINELKNEEEALKKEINLLAEIEADINQRQTLEVEKNNLKEKIEKLKKLKESWPLLKAELENLKFKENDFETELKKLQAEKLRAKKMKTKKELENKKEKIDKLEKEITKLREKTLNSNLNTAKISELEEYKMKIDQSQASLKAAKLKAKLNFSSAKKIKITTGVGDEKELKPGEIVEADGYLQIKTKDIDIEIESAEIDFPALKATYQKNKEKFKNLKSKLDVATINEAREKLNILNEIKINIQNKEVKIKELLGEMNKDELRQNLKEYQNLKSARDLELIEEKIEAKKELKNEIKTQIAVKENNIESWQRKYSSLENMFQILEDKKRRAKKITKELDNLESLPAEFNSAAEFKSELKKKRKRVDKINQKLREKLQQLKIIENNLPKLSSSEMENKLARKEAEFKQLIKKAKNLLKIKKVFEKKLKKVDQNSFNPLLEAFNENLTKLTAGKYQSGIIDKDFKIALEKDYKKIPANIKLLSYGTYDVVALALRFAIFENLFADQQSFIVLDDCLVNLDPERKEKAIDLINEYQQKYQIIYTTCNPERLNDFKANIIEV